MRYTRHGRSCESAMEAAALMNNASKAFQKIDFALAGRYDHPRQLGVPSG